MIFRSFQKRALALICALFAVLTLVGCNKLESTKEERATVFTVDAYEIPYEQLRYLVRNYMAEYGDSSFWTEEKAAELQEEIFAKAISSLKDQYAILALAEEYGIDKNSDMIRTIIDRQRTAAIEEYGGENAYAAALEENFMTDGVYLFFLTANACSEELYHAMLQKGELDPASGTVTEALYGDAFVRVKQILIKTDEGENKEENRALAESLQKRAAAGEDFDALVNEYGEDLFMFKNTDGYYICRGVWHHAFEDTAFALAIGEISDVIETEAGYSILMRCEKEASYISAHTDTLTDDYYDARFSLAIEAKAEKMTVTTTDTFASYTLLTME